MTKHSLIFLLISLSLVSCRQNVARKAITKTPNKNVSRVPVNYQSPLLQQYGTFISSLSFNKAENTLIAADNYKTLFKTASVEIRDSAFTIFDAFYLKLGQALDDSPEKESMNLDKYYAYSDSVRKIPQKVNAYIKHLKQCGFELREEEGSMYIVEDRDFIASWFYYLVSPILKEYLIQENKENKNVYAEDASITIEYNELVKRAIWWERFSKNRPAFVYQNQAEEMKLTYLDLLLQGSDNSWVLEPETKNLEDYFEKAYTYLEKKYPSSETGKIVIPYYHLLSAHQNGKADSLLKNYGKRGIIKRVNSAE